DRQRFEQIGDNESNSVAERRQATLRLLDHRQRCVERDDLTSRQSTEEQLGDAPGAAARVEDPLVAGELQAIDDRGSPAGHRIRDPIVCRRIPLASHGESMPSGRHARTPPDQRGPDDAMWSADARTASAGWRAQPIERAALTMIVCAYRSWRPCLVGLCAVVTSSTMTHTILARPISAPIAGAPVSAVPRAPSPNRRAQRIAAWLMVMLLPSVSLP